MLAGAFVKKGPKRAPRPRSPGDGEPPGSLAESRPVPTLAPAQRGSAGGGSSLDARPGNRPSSWWKPILVCRQLITRRRTVSSLCSVIVAREARTIAERSRPSTQAAGTRARGGWEPACRRDARTSHMQPLCFKQRPRPSPRGRQED